MFGFLVPETGSVMVHIVFSSTLLPLPQCGQSRYLPYTTSSWWTTLLTAGQLHIVDFTGSSDSHTLNRL